MSHTCHATGCEVKVPPEMFACKRHWYMLSKALRDRKRKSAKGSVRRRKALETDLKKPKWLREKEAQEQAWADKDAWGRFQAGVGPDPREDYEK